MQRRAVVTGSTRRALGVLLVVALVVSAVAFLVATVRKVQADQQIGMAEAPPVPGASTESSRSTPVPPSTPEEPSDDASGGGEPGVLLVIDPTPDGTFAVTETVRLPTPANTITLRPPRVAGAGAPFTDLSPVATDVQVSADGAAIAVPEETVADPVDLAVEEVSVFEITYELDGTLVRTRPAESARALAAVSPLVSGLDDTLPVTVVVTGDSVLSVNCPLLTLRQQACGVGSTPRMTVEDTLTVGRGIVTIALTLPSD